MVVCLERGADLHVAQLIPLPLTVSCFSKIQTGFTFLVPAHLGSTGQRAVKRLCVCVVIIAVDVCRQAGVWFVGRRASRSTVVSCCQCTRCQVPARPPTAPRSACLPASSHAMSRCTRPPCGSSTTTCCVPSTLPAHVDFVASIPRCVATLSAACCSNQQLVVVSWTGAEPW